MVIGVFAVGWAAHSTHNLRHALAEGARALQLKPTITQSELQTLVRSKVFEAHGPDDVSVTLTIDPLSAGVQLAHTTASYPVSVHCSASWELFLFLQRFDDCAGYRKLAHDASELLFK